jgi:hypothetical protein
MFLMGRLTLKSLSILRWPLGIVLLLVLVVGSLAEYRHRQGPFLHIEAGDVACPDFCKNDIKQWDFFDRDAEQVSKGDYVVLNDNWEGFYTTRILSDPVTKACAEDDRTEFQLPDGNIFCNIKALQLGQEDFGWTYSGISNGDRKYFYQYDYLVSGHLNILLTTPVRFHPRKMSMTNKYVIRGVRPVKIANTHKYHIYSEAVTDLVGRGLFYLLKWTGINLFGEPVR